ncbi:NO-inducible flavohemoprotein [Larkinella insperata]|uniref:nitric oxide dioxygenase n=1 Tax=Larkinella insperata TaxID=332158 RepID=A0ABW3QBQ8_9BACT|nr:NO-inducible flavohemoprotein [Larkinella insperata]
MTTEQKQLIKATVPVLRESGVALTSHFYRRMFSFNPELKNVFNQGNQQNGRQQTALAMAVLAYAEHIDNPAVLLPVLEHIGHKHTSLDIRPEHYAIVGRHLMASIAEVLGESATPELLEAWRNAYQALADLMIGTEAQLYASQVNKTGGWTGWRPFVVKTKVIESEEVTSFHLYPADGGPVADHLPGQYLSVRVLVPQLNLLQPRQYSISNAPNQLYYRISVKRESGRELTPDGMVSNQLHTFIREGDRLDVSAPAGDFSLKTDAAKPVVFLSGGIGQTPLLSMLESLVANGSSRPIHWIHGCRNQAVHAFKGVVDYYASYHRPLEKHIFYDEVETLNETDPVYEGFVDLNRLPSDSLPTEAEYYLCGPPVFITRQYADLLALGVRKEAIHYEEFGPQLLSLN